MCSTKKGMRFVFQIKPIGKGRARMSRFSNRVYTPSETRNFERQIALMARSQYHNLPLETPIEMNVWFNFKRPKTVTREYHTVKPDISNCLKAIEDALNGIAYIDDAQIVKSAQIKQYMEADSIIVEVLSMV